MGTALINCLDYIFFCEKAIGQNVIIGCLHFKHISYPVLMCIQMLLILTLRKIQTKK